MAPKQFIPLPWMLAKRSTWCAPANVDDNPGKCYVVCAKPGDIVIVPPAWAYATISADTKIPLT